jgi:hypothetical protein
MPKSSTPTVLIALVVAVMFFGGFFALLAVVLPPNFNLIISLAVSGLMFVGIQYFILARVLYPLAIRMERPHRDAAESATGPAAAPLVTQSDKNSTVGDGRV